MSKSTEFAPRISSELPHQDDLPDIDLRAVLTGEEPSDGPFMPRGQDWTDPRENRLPSFVRKYHDVRSEISEKRKGEPRPSGEASSYEDLLGQSRKLIENHLGEIVTGTKLYREELARRLNAEGVEDGDNLDDETFLRAILTGDILNYFEDFRLTHASEYLTILAISQAVQLEAIASIREWNEKGQITQSELAAMSMTPEELSIVLDYELAVGPYQNMIFNKTILYQSELAGSIPSAIVKDIYDSETQSGILFEHTYSEFGNHVFQRPTTYFAPEWQAVARIAEELPQKARSLIPREVWWKNWGPSFDHYMASLAIVMRSGQVDRPYIDKEYSDHLQIVQDNSPDYASDDPFAKPFIRFVPFPEVMEDASMAQACGPQVTWMTDMDVMKGVKYWGFREVFQRRIDRLVNDNPALVESDRDKTAGIARPMTKIGRSGATSESNMSGARAWSWLLELFPSQIDGRTADYRWPFLMASGLVDGADEEAFHDLCEAVQLYFVAHEGAHGVAPDYQRSILEELKADLYGLSVLAEFLGGAENIPDKFAKSLILAVISENLYNLAASSATLDSQGSLYLAPAIIEMDFITNLVGQNGTKLVTIDEKGQIEVSDYKAVLLALVLEGDRIMKKDYVEADLKESEPSDKVMLEWAMKILETRSDLNDFFSNSLREWFKKLSQKK